MPNDWGYLATLVLMLVPVHQGLVEAFKTVTGIKLRRYFEAIAEIVYGPGYELLTATSGGRGLDNGSELLAGEQPNTVQKIARLSIGEWVGSKAKLVPKELGRERRLEWVQGAQRRLVESFVQRGVGDSPNPDISEQDIENVITIIREEATAYVRDAARRLRYLAQHGSGSPADAAATLRGIDATGDAGTQINRWADEVEKLHTGTAVDVALRAYKDMFVERFLPREHAARIELPNILKSAELRYHFDLLRISILVAIAEGIAVSYISDRFNGVDALLVTLITATSLFVLSQGSKGLVDTLIGLGARLKF
jgi:hypothetical protein